MTLEPQETSPETSLFEQGCSISPRALKSYRHLCALGCCVPQLFLWSLSLSSYFNTHLMQIHRNKLVLFSCLQESLISVLAPPSHHSGNTSLKARAQRLQKNIYIFTSITEYMFYVFKFRKKASHIHTKIHQENTRGKTLPTARNTQKSTVIATVTFFWGVYSIEETSLCIGESQILGPIFLCQLVWIKSVRFLLFKKVHGIIFLFFFF